ncbi:MAG: M3 family metallopeptidase [Acidobacteriota bacterium]
MNHPVLALFACSLLVLATGCTCCDEPCVSDSCDNPLLAESTLPFGAPPFDQIEEAHFAPAFEAAMQAHNAEVQAIVNQAEEPTFENTLEALDLAGRSLDNVRLIFLNINAANTTEGIQALAKEINPKLAGHRDDILMNEGLFARVKAVYDARESMGLPTESARLLDKHYRRFVRGGANLEADAKERMKELNAELTTMSTQFGENLLKEMNSVALLIDDEADLAGLPQSVRDSAAAVATAQDHEGAWAFNLQRTSWTPFLQLSERRDLREKLYRAYTNLCANGGETDNRALASRIAALRVERANLLGFETHAAYVVDDNMAETPEKVNDLLDTLWTPALAKAKTELAELQALADSLGDDLTVEMWDWWFYSEKLRAAKYDFDESAVKPYLELSKVRQAAFDVAGRLWGLQFIQRDDLPGYHPDQVAFEVQNTDGSHVGVFYVDYFARESKRGGAWMEDVRRQWKVDGENIRPIVTNTCNFSKPSEGQPALLSLDEAATLFHEFGHALHGLLSDVTYSSLSGTNVARDFVELPSQMMENWALDPAVLPTYARHFETGEPIPAALIEKLQKAKQFNQGFATTEYLAASILDMDWHTLGEAANQDAMAFEKASMDRIGIIEEIVSRYRTPYFGHIFSGGYSAGYYSYVWAEVLDADGFVAFKEAGVFDRELAESYRKNILSAGDSENPMVLYERFRGAAPTIDALVARRGLE